MITFSRYDTDLGTQAVLTVGVGATVESHVNRSVQVMSDVWDSQRVVTFLANPSSLKYGEPKWRTVTTSLYEFPDKHFSYEIDASPEIAALWAAHQANLIRVARERKAIEAHAARAAEAKAQAATVRRGDWVTVVKGRKVPRGTAGRVIWVGDGNYGTRVGFVDIHGNAHWTALQNVRREVMAPESLRRAVPAPGSAPRPREVPLHA